MQLKHEGTKCAKKQKQKYPVEENPFKSWAKLLAAMEHPPLPPPPKKSKLGKLGLKTGPMESIRKRNLPMNGSLIWTRKSNILSLF